MPGSGTAAGCRPGTARIRRRSGLSVPLPAGPLTAGAPRILQGGPEGRSRRRLGALAFALLALRSGRASAGRPARKADIGGR